MPDRASLAHAYIASILVNNEGNYFVPWLMSLIASETQTPEAEMPAEASEMAHARKPGVAHYSAEAENAGRDFEMGPERQHDCDTGNLYSINALDGEQRRAQLAAEIESAYQNSEKCAAPI